MSSHTTAQNHPDEHNPLLGAIHPSGWAPARGYANGVSIKGRQIYVAGQIGWDPTNGRFEQTGFVQQVEQALRNIVAVLHAANAGPEHLVRLTWFITDKAEYLDAQREIGRAYRDVIGRHFPAMSVVVVSALIEDAAKVEIEATAVVPE